MLIRDSSSAAMSHNTSGQRRSRLPVVQGKPVFSSNAQFTATNKFGFPTNLYSTTNEFKSSSNGEQIFTRRNIFNTNAPQQFNSPWAASVASEDGEVDSQGPESVRKFCTEDTPVSLSKAGSNTNLSSLTFDDDDHISTPGHAKPNNQLSGMTSILYQFSINLRIYDIKSVVK